MRWQTREMRCFLYGSRGKTGEESTNQWYFVEGLEALQQDASIDSGFCSRAVSCPVWILILVKQKRSNFQKASTGLKHLWVPEGLFTVLSTFIFNQMNKGSLLKTLSECVSPTAHPSEECPLPRDGSCLAGHKWCWGCLTESFSLLISCPMGREDLLRISLGWSGMDRSCSRVCTQLQLCAWFLWLWARSWWPLRLCFPFTGLH